MRLTASSFPAPSTPHQNPLASHPSTPCPTAPSVSRLHVVMNTTAGQGLSVFQDVNLGAPPGVPHVILLLHHFRSQGKDGSSLRKGLRKWGGGRAERPPGVKSIGVVSLRGHREAILGGRGCFLQ